MNRKSRPLVIGVGASAGGHANQLLSLLSHIDCWPEPPAFYVTTLDVVAKKLGEGGKPTYVLGECDRRRWLAVPGVVLRALRCAWRERPDVVVTTGSMPLLLFCVASKLLGSRIVWIDSIANSDRLSMSGNLARRIADLCLTQWPEVAARLRGVECVGQLI